MPVTLPLFQSPFSPLFGDPTVNRWGGSSPSDPQDDFITEDGGSYFVAESSTSYFQQEAA